MASLKAAIKAKCKDCTYDPQVPGTYLEQIEMCTVTSCPLWTVRPMTVATINLIRKEKLTAAGPGIDIDALVAGLDDEEESEAETDMVAA